MPSPRRRSPLPPASPSAGFEAVAGPRLTHAPDRAALERMVVTLATHPEAGAAPAATLLRWRPAAGRLETSAVRRGRGRAPESLDAALQTALGPTPRPRGREDEVPSFGCIPEDLPGVAAEAWLTSAPVAGWGGGTGLPWSDAPGIAAIALKGASGPWGLLVIETRATTPDAAATAVLARVAALAALGFDALEARETARRDRIRADGLADVARAAVSSLHLAEVLARVARAAARGVEGDACLIWSGADDAPFRLEVGDVAGTERDALARALMPAARETFATGQARELDSAVDPRTWPPDAPAALDRVILVPLAAYGRVTGVLGVALRGGAWEFPGAAATERAFLETLADLAALAREQARRFEELERARARLDESAARLRREERLAALGEVARRAAQDARNPLASIGAFARRLQRTLHENDANREYLEIILRESERLERLLAEEAEATDPEPPALELASLNALAQEAIQAAAESLVRRRIRMLKRLTPDLPMLLLDTRRVRRAIANLLDNALDAARSGGRLRVETRRAGGNAVLEVAHDGGPIAGGVLEQLFVPFASARPGGPAVGLAVAERIVRGHGGEIRVRSEGEWTAIVTITLPLRGNEDRRRQSPDRRARHPDRRMSAART